MKGVGALVALSGPSAKMAHANIQKNPRRIAATGAALLIGVTLVSTIATGAASAKETMNDALATRYSVDVVATGSDISQQMASAVKAVKGIFPKHIRIVGLGKANSHSAVVAKLFHKHVSYSMQYVGGVKGKVLYAGIAQGLFLFVQRLYLLVGQPLAPAEPAAVAAPAHGRVQLGAGEFRIEALKPGVVYVAAVVSAVFREAVLCPCVAPGALGYVSMEDRHAAGYAEFHLARKVRLPFAVCLAVEYGELISPLKGVQRHARCRNGSFRRVWLLFPFHLKSLWRALPAARTLRHDVL